MLVVRLILQVDITLARSTHVQLAMTMMMMMMSVTKYVFWAGVTKHPSSTCTAIQTVKASIK